MKKDISPEVSRDFVMIKLSTGNVLQRDVSIATGVVVDFYKNLKINELQSFQLTFQEYICK
jgi:hypothetical protein